MGTGIPTTVDADTVDCWSDDVDVLVIGFGIAGGCAAVSAAAAGARVLVLERAAVAGGTTSLAGGHFYLGGGTAVQQVTGHPDSPDEMYKYLVAVSRQPDHVKIRAYCDGSVEHFHWLEDLGFQFERSYFADKAVIQPNTEGLMFTGNEKVWPFSEMAIPAPRGHKVPVPGDTGGASMVIGLLVKRAASLGVQVRYEAGATELVVDPSGTVTGVCWKQFGKTGAIKAKSVMGVRDEPGHGGPTHTEARRKAIRSGKYLRRWAGYPDGRIGWGCHPAYGPDFHYSSAVPAVNIVDRNYRQQVGAAVYRRRFLPFQDIWIHHGSAGECGFFDPRRGALNTSRAAVDPADRWLGNGR